MKFPKEIRNNKYLLDDLIIKMRFQNSDPLKHDDRACMSYLAISKLVDRSVTYCRDISLQFVKDKKSILSKSIMKSRSKK